MFTIEERDNVRERVVEMARSDRRVVAGALTGSRAVDAEDERSDIDLAFGIADGVSLEAVLDDWTETLDRELGVLHHWDLPFGSSIYRVFLLPSGLEIDVGLSPQQDFRARGPRFRTLFGTHGQPGPSPQPNPEHLIGLAGYVCHSLVLLNGVLYLNQIHRPTLRHEHPKPNRSYRCHGQNLSLPDLTVART